MKRSSIALVLGGVLSGFVFGYVVQDHQDSEEPTPQTTPESSIEPIDAKRASTMEKDLLLQAIHELDLTTAELADATARIKRMELKAKRYDWLKNNGIRDYSLSFNQYSFQPSPKLLEFLGLDKTDSEAVMGIAETARGEIKKWESDQAVCIQETATNCVYEIPPVPESYKEAFRKSLESILHPDDVELLSYSIDQIYDRLQQRKVSIAFASTEWHKSFLYGVNGSPPDRISIEEEWLDESGRNRGSSSSTGPFGQSTYLNEQWGHLFTLDNFSQ